MELETVPLNRRRQNSKTAAVSIPVLFAAQVARPVSIRTRGLACLMAT
jgi:hypothetical protein